jgi:cytochrome c oxidase subunit 2
MSKMTFFVTLRRKAVCAAALALVPVHRRLRARMTEDGYRVALALVVVGSVVFHFLSPWWWTPIASNWRYIDDTIIITFWITGAVFAAVVLFMAYCVFRFRHREGEGQAAYEPENKRLEWWLAIGTAVGVAAMLAPGLVRLEPVRHVPKDAPTSRSSASNGSGATACPARTASSARPTSPMSPRQPARVSTRTIRNGQDDVIIQGDRAASAARQAGQDAAALARRPA